MSSVAWVISLEAGWGSPELGVVNGLQPDGEQQLEESSYSRSLQSKAAELTMGSQPLFPRGQHRKRQLLWGLSLSLERPKHSMLLSRKRPRSI